jgi:hypothetical protein
MEIMKLPFYFMQRTLTLFTAFVLVLTFSACKDDDVKPTTARIYGTITIDNTNLWATWRDSGEVQLTIFPEFSLNPPAGWGPVPDNFFGPGVPGGTFAIGAPYNAQDPKVQTYEPGKTQYPYEIIVDPGTYSALALGFRHNHITDPSKRTATLGVHWDNPATVSHGIVIKVNIMGNIVPIFNFPPPVPITVEAGDNVQIDFRADFGFVEDWY